MKKIILALIAALTLISCETIGTEEVKDAFTTTFTRYGLYQNAVPKFTYSESDHQIATKIGSSGMAELYEFRLMDDTQSQLLSVEIAGGINQQIGATATVTINSTGISGVETVAMRQMTVVKVDTERIWLLEASSTVGVIAPIAQ